MVDATTANVFKTGRLDIPALRQTKVDFFMD